MSVAAPTTPRPRPPVVRARPRNYRAMIDRSRTVGMFSSIAARHGDVVEIRIARHRLWLVSNAQWAREVMVDHGRSVGKGEGIRVLKLVLGNGILTNEDPVSHKRNRRLINPALSPGRLRGYADVMAAAALRADARWQDGQVVEITGEMSRIALDVVGRTLLGDDTDQDAASITAAVQTVVKRFGLGFLPGAARMVDSPLPPFARIRHAVAAMRGTVERIVGEHRDAQRRSDDMVAALLAANEDGESLGEEQVRDETLTLMLAGFETTANALAWTWWLLNQNPQVADRLRREAAEVLGDAPATYDDLARLPYATAAIAETLRLRPPAWILEREVREPIDIGGYHADAGTTVLMSPWIIHRDPRYWGADAQDYRPERWLDANGGFDHAAPGQPRGAYFPFGAGSRICIGESFAWAEAVIVLTTLVRRWAPVTEPGQEIGTWAAVTLRPHPGIRMRLERAGVAATVPS